MKRIISLLLMTNLLACGGESNQPQTLELNHFLSTCYGAFPRLCYTQMDESQTYANIEGFDYEWGHQYVLRVEPVPVDIDVQDDPGSFRLLEVVSDTVVPADERFEISINKDFVAETSSTGFSLFNERRVRCASDEICTQINDQLGSSDMDSFTVIFVHGEDELVAVAVP